MLISRLGDELQSALDLQIGRFKGLGSQQFPFPIVKVASLAIDQAELLVKVGLDGAVTTLCNGRL